MHVGVQGRVCRRQMAFLKIGFWNIYGPFIWLSVYTKCLERTQSTVFYLRTFEEKCATVR